MKKYLKLVIILFALGSVFLFACSDNSSSKENAMANLTGTVIISPSQGVASQPLAIYEANRDSLTVDSILAFADAQLMTPAEADVAITELTSRQPKGEKGVLCGLGEGWNVFVVDTMRPYSSESRVVRMVFVGPDDTWVISDYSLDLEFPKGSARFFLRSKF